MDDETVNINKIMGNSTRREILSLIGQSGEISYVDIRQALGRINTGKLNYHLKILGNLITKNQATGKYALTGEGAAALSSSLMHNNAAYSSIEDSSTKSLGSSLISDTSVLVGIIVPLIVLSSLTYYVFVYLGVVKISTIIPNVSVWAVVLFFTWRGIFYHVNGEKSLEHAIRGGR